MQIRKKKRIREGMVEHLTIGNHIANCIIHFCLIMVAVISLLPMWHVCSCPPFPTVSACFRTRA